MPTPKKSVKAKASPKLKDLNAKKDPKGGSTITTNVAAAVQGGWNRVRN